MDAKGHDRNALHDHTMHLPPEKLPHGLVVVRALPTMEFDPAARCDVSTITSKAVDSDGDIILPEGLDWDRFHEDGSPVHYAHHSLRVGRALWVKARGDKVIAKTRYDSAPKGWDASKPWLGDVVFDAVRKGALTGKSITVLPQEEREPSAEEKAQGAKRVITKGVVAEFSVCKAPVNHEALVEEICKAMDELQSTAVNEELEWAAELERVFQALLGQR